MEKEPLLYGDNLNVPCAIFKSLIVIKNPIPGLTLRLRNFAFLMTLAALIISSWETYRYAMKQGPLAESPWTISWVIIMLIGSITGLLGATLLQKHMILISSLVFCCIMGPLTPNMIVESGGVDTWHFITVAILWVVIGGTLAALFCQVESELTTREVGTDKFGIINVPAQGKTLLLQPCGCEIVRDELVEEHGK